MINQQKDILTEGSVLSETNEYTNDIYMIDEQDYVHGGVDGYDNVPHQQLANRTKYLKSTIESLTNYVNTFKNDFNNQNSANLTEFADIKTSISKLSSYVDNLKILVDSNKNSLQAEIDTINSVITTLQNLLLTHTHKYAGSDIPGGDANTVKIVDSTNKFYLSGSDDVNPNIIKRDKNAFVQNNSLTVQVVNGDLNGESTSTKHLTNPINISLYGDITGLAQLDGSVDIKMSTKKSSNGVISGNYGPANSSKLNSNDTFIVPNLDVDSSGSITGITNKQLTLPDNDELGNTTNATNASGKLFLIGSIDQVKSSKTYTQLTVFEKNGLLYSNNIEVVNLSNPQNIINKTYNGYVLDDACAHGVDTIATKNSTNLITSNAVYEQTYNYAGSDVSGGDANTVKIVEDNNNVNYLVCNDGVTNNVLHKNTEIYIQGSTLNVGDVNIKNSLKISGGELWITEATGV